MIGGRLEDDNAAVYAEMHRLSGGRIVVFPTASGEPEVVGQEVLDVFRAHGFDAVLAPVFGEGAAAAAADPAIGALVLDYGSVFFTGGNQALITAALAPKGRSTPLLDAIHDARAAGGLVAGSSAGAAMMSDVMIEGGTSLEAATYGVVTDPDKPGLLLGEGLGFFTHGVVDQHFIKRGRFGRLAMALASSGTRRGYGIDENTALFVNDDRGWVVGEYGVFLLDMRDARFDRRRRNISYIGVSYLDDGDAFDLDDYAVTVGDGKRVVADSEVAYRAPAHTARNVFGAYTLYDLLARLVLGDVRSYTADEARAIEPKMGISTSVRLERLSGETVGLIAWREAMLRMTALGFRASMIERKLDAAQLAASRRAALARDYGVVPGVDARLVMLGSSPLRCEALLESVVGLCGGKIGIIAAASSDSRYEADNWARAFRRHGIEAEDLGITIDNVETSDEVLIGRIAELKTIILTGGNQIRLVETLLHRGEVTPVLQAVVQAYAAGATVVASAGAASALSGSMIAGGSSYEALRYGVASDMGRRGIVIQEGIGLFGPAIVDQNLAKSRRLARLLVACAEEGVRFGLGLCEESGVVANADNTLLTVVGMRGVVLLEVDPQTTKMQGDDLQTLGTRVHLALAGDMIDLNAGVVIRSAPAAEAEAVLKDMIGELLDDCIGVGDGSPDGPIILRFSSSGGGCGILDVESIRDRND